VQRVRLCLHRPRETVQDGADLFLFGGVQFAQAVAEFNQRFGFDK
jgi:hypothetical protein